MKRNLQSVMQLAAASPFTEAQLRWWIFEASRNGLAAVGAIVKIGRRVYIDTDRFDDWITAQNTAQVAA
ncbi:MAG: DNA-binding protein [Tahibacter sp.]